MRGASPQRGQSGQAAVESALILPLMVALGLGLLQLTLMQQSRLMTEYAAYCAARAGIVWNGHHERMHDAALLALLPTLGRTDGLSPLARTWGLAQRDDEALQRLPWADADPGVPGSVNGSSLLGQVRVDTVNPSASASGEGVGTPRPASTWQELDFDGPDTWPRAPGLDSPPARAGHPSPPEGPEDVYREATVLSVRVRYWYELRVPFASWVLFTAWWAAHAGVSLGGALWRPTLDARANITQARGRLDAAGGLPVRGLSHQRGYDTLSPAEMTVLWGLATGSLRLGSREEGPHYFLPLTATYSMRMQSNVYRKWLMHPGTDGGAP